MVGLSPSMKEANSEAPIESPADTTKLFASPAWARYSSMVPAKRTVSGAEAAIRPWKSLKLSTVSWVVVSQTVARAGAAVATVVAPRATAAMVAARRRSRKAIGTLLVKVILIRG